MGKTYINGLGCISAQKTFESSFVEEFERNVSDNVLPVKTPTYKDFIPPAAIRRMAKGVKNGIVAANLAMKEANVENLDAIITGTGMGCIEDSDKFLKALLDNNEEFLTPTSFIQSTHNTVGSQIALGIQCKAYNFTYVNAAVSFESAILDAKMQIDSDESSTILVGGIDEMSDYTSRLFKLAGMIKSDDEAPYDVLKSKTKGAVYGEGATFFVLENQKTTTTYAEIVDVEMNNVLAVNEIEEKLKVFLKKNNLEVSNLDAVVLGYNGDVEYDVYYSQLTETIFKDLPQVYYKHYCGEYNTASSFGLWIASKIVKNQEIPDVLKVNTIDKSEYKTVVLYNQYKGIDHSFTLITKC